MSSPISEAQSLASHIQEKVSRGVVTPLVEMSSKQPLLSAATLIVAALSLSFALMAGKGKDAPPVPEPVPFFSNTYHYMSNLISFCSKASKLMQNSNKNIAYFYLWFKKVYLIVGGSNTEMCFRRSSGLTSDKYVMLFLDTMFHPTAADYAQWDKDKTGRLKVPERGTENSVPAKDRIWIQWHGIENESLTKPKASYDLATLYFDRFKTNLDAKFPHIGSKQSSLPLNNFIYEVMTEAAATSLAGTMFLEMYPDFFSIMSEFEAAILPISFGPPRWLNPGPYRVRDRWMKMNMDITKAAIAKFDFDGPEGELPWTPMLGSPFNRDLLKFGMRRGFALRTLAGMVGVQILNQNSNTVPAAVWALMDLITSDPELRLIERLDEEAASVEKRDEITGETTFDIVKLATLPLHQAVYTETLRLRCSFNITRVAVKDVEIGGYDVKKGNWVQAPTLIAHYNPIWTSKGHGPEEFYPDRHLVVNEKTDKTEFSLGERTGYWFPYGGGITMCPGRNFAKMEIVLTIAVMVRRFKMEKAGWVMKNDLKTQSDREAKNSDGFVTMLPDRELLVNMERTSF